MNSQWKLVPVEPTETMVINGFESEPDECFTDEEVWEQYQEMSGCQQAAFRAKLCWAAMLSSAPAPDKHNAAPEEPAGVDFGIDGRSVRVSQEAYSIFLAREAAGREKIEALQQRLNAADQKIDDLEAELGPTFDEVRAKNEDVAESLQPGTGRCTFDVLWKSGGSAVDATITEEQYSEILKILNRDVAILSTAFRGAVSQ